MPRSSIRRIALVAGTLALAVPTLAPPASAVHPSRAAEPSAVHPPAATGAAAALTAPASVTLLTGEKVTLMPAGGGPPKVIVDPGTTPDAVVVQRTSSTIQVIPRSLVPLVPKVIDPALFDVLGLVKMGYDDQHRSSIPLIAHLADGARALAVQPGTTGVRPLPSIGGEAFTLPKSQADGFGERLRRAGLSQAQPARARSLADTLASTLGGIDHLWLDAPVAGTGEPAGQPAADTEDVLDGYLTQVGAPAAWQAGLDGTGVTVAVLDSGIDTGHPALAGRVGLAQNFTDTAEVTDVAGHGTHVASLLAGSGAGSAGARKGIAPGATLLSGKVLDDEEHGQASWVIEGMQWAVANGADVVNMSLGGTAGTTDDPLVQAVDSLTAQSGTLFVIAAGNTGTLGPSPETITSPGTAASALTVAAVTDQDRQAGFSSEGPVSGNYRTKPDVAAPGVEIPGARAGARDGDADLYIPMSGTSMATPIVAGAAALAHQQHPGWTWQQVKSAISNSAAPAGTAWTQGGGRLALDRLIGTTVTADPAAISPGGFRHPDESPRSTTVRLVNSGTTARTYTATDAESDTGGGAAPAGALVASPAQVTVPAGGSAAITVSFDPGAVPDGYWQGSVDFTGDDGSVLRLPFGTFDEPERYTLQLRVLDRAGQPWAGGDVPLQNLDTGGFTRAFLDDSGEATLRLPPGHWTALARIEVPAADGDPGSLTIAGTPDVDLHADTALTIDARSTRALRPPAVAGTPTTATQFSMVYSAIAPDGAGGYSELVFPDVAQVRAGRLYVSPVAAGTSGFFEVASHWRLEPNAPKHNSPDAYEIQEVTDGFAGQIAPIISDPEQQHLARVTLDYHGTQPGATQAASTVTASPHTDAVVIQRPVTVPSTVVELTTAQPNAFWGRCLTMPENAVTELCQPIIAAYRPGDQVTLHPGRGLHVELSDAYQYPGGAMFLQQAVTDGLLVGRVVPPARASATTTLYRDGDLVARSDDDFGWFEVSDEPASYTLVGDYTLATGTLPVRSHTVWRFRSGAPQDPNVGQAIPPILRVDYGPDVDGLGRATAGRPLTFGLSIGHQSGSTATARIASATLSWSPDAGVTWHPAGIRRTGEASFVATVSPQDVRRGTVLSLRLKAADADGNSIDQTALQFVPVS